MAIQIAIAAAATQITQREWIAAANAITANAAARTANSAGMAKRPTPG